MHAPRRTYARPGDPLDLVGGDSTSTAVPAPRVDGLRREAPVHRFETETFPPSGAIVKYGDVRPLATAAPIPERPRLVMSPSAFRCRARGERAIAAQHGPPITSVPRARNRHSRNTRSRLRPHSRALPADRRRRGRARRGPERLARATSWPTVAARLPLAVIMELLGVPRGAWEKVFHWSNEAIAPATPSTAAAAPLGDRRASAASVLRLLRGILPERRRDPTRRPRQHPLGRRDRRPHRRRPRDPLVLFPARGRRQRDHATPPAAACWSLIEHPRRAARGCARIRTDPNRRGGDPPLDSPWCTSADRRGGRRDPRPTTTPRAPVALLSFGESRRGVFQEPFRFDVGRSPNDHYAFGIGEHFCLGRTSRARAEVMLGECLRPLRGLELAGASNASARAWSVASSGCRSASARRR